MIGHVVLDADREMVLGLDRIHIVKRGDHLRRSDIFGRQAIAPGDDHRRRGNIGERRADVFVQRLARRAGLFGTIEHGHAAHAFRQSGKEMFRRKRSIKMDLQKTHFLAT